MGHLAPVPTARTDGPPKFRRTPVSRLSKFARACRGLGANFDQHKSHWKSWTCCCDAQSRNSLGDNPESTGESTDHHNSQTAHTAPLKPSPRGDTSAGRNPSVRYGTKIDVPPALPAVQISSAGWRLAHRRQRGATTARNRCRSPSHLSPDLTEATPSSFAAA